MNINSNELLLLSKKVKFGEGVNEGGNQANSMVSEPEVASNPQTGMNALMFQGMKNVASDPSLATELKVMNDIEPSQADSDSAKEYVAPYKSNLAFQGKASKFKSIAMAALIGLSSMGAVSTLTSCEKMEVTQQVDFDLTMLMDMINELKALRNDLANSDKEMAAKYDQLISMFQQLLTMMQEQAVSNAQFQSLILANQDIIIDLLVKNGMKQDEANAKLDEILKAVQSGTMTIQEALDAIKNLLVDIKGMLGEAIADFKAYFEKMLEKQNELINTNKEGFEELIKQGKITNETLANIENQNTELLELNEKQLNALNNIKLAIEQSNIDNNANFEKVIETLNINKNELISVMTKLGYSFEQIIKMTASEIIEAINYNTEVTNEGNKMLVEIAKYITILPDIYNENKITNEQIQNLYNLYLEIINNGIGDGQFSKEILEKMEQLLQELKGIAGILGEISEKLTTLINDFKAFREDYSADKDEELALLKELIKSNKFQNSVLVNMSKTQKNMSENIKGIRNSVNTLLEIAQDDSRHQELIEAIKNIQINGGNGGSANIDYEALEAMFTAMGIKIADAINMSASQLEQVIKNFQQTYVDVEAAQTEQLATIIAKLDDIKYFNGLNKDEIIEAIKNVSIQGGGTSSPELGEKLDAIIEALNNMQATLNAIYKAIGDQAAKVDSYFQKWDTKFDQALELLENIDTKISTVISNQKIAEEYLNNLNIEVQNLKTEIKNIQVAGGNIDYDKLEEMWNKHDEANFAKYSKLIKDLGIDTTDLKTIEDLLASIDAKLDNIKDNSDILNQILAKLNGIDWSNPNYSEKLDQIIELLKNFKCNCQCGGNNEGVLGVLNDILGK